MQAPCWVLGLTDRCLAWPCPTVRHSVNPELGVVGRSGDIPTHLHVVVLAGGLLRLQVNQNRLALVDAQCTEPDAGGQVDEPVLD